MVHKMADRLRTDDTIAAIASGVTNVGISIIRISGPDSFKIAEKVFKKKDCGYLVGYAPSIVDSHTVHYGYIVDNVVKNDNYEVKIEEKSDLPEICNVHKSVYKKLNSGLFQEYHTSELVDIVDEVMMLVFAAPKTYTREDTIEIDCHGGALVTKKVLETVIKAGARLAEPGEFTKRAFLNGRIDLSQAEAVAGIINAKNTMALGNSIRQLGGVEQRKIEEIRNSLLSDTAFIEAGLDDPEHISLDGFSETLRENVDKNCLILDRMIKSADNGRLISEGINTVIVGKPNAGKSTLLNAILGEERAIVTDIAGTTRDTLEESVSFEGISLNIIDTAGIRDTEDRIEKIGVDRAISAMENADLVLYVVDITDDINEDDRKIIEKIGDRKLLVLLNKSDLVNSSQSVDFSNSLLLQADLENGIEHSTGQKSLQHDVKNSIITILGENHKNVKIISISAKQGEGLETLGSAIREMFFSGEVLPNDEVYITSMRHKECLMNARKSLEMVIDSIDAGMSEDFFTIDMMNAYTELGLIIGEDTDEDLVDRIFRDFCMGK